MNKPDRPNRVVGIRTSRKRSQAPLEYIRISVRFLPNIQAKINKLVKKSGYKTRDEFFRASISELKQNLPNNSDEWATVIALYDETPTGGDKMINIRFTGKSAKDFQDILDAMEKSRYMPKGIKTQIIFASIAKHVIDFKNSL